MATAKKKPAKKVTTGTSRKPAKKKAADARNSRGTEPASTASTPSPASPTARSGCSHSYGPTVGRPSHHGYDSRSELPPPNGPVFKPGRFGRMFPHLPALIVPDASLTELAAAMRDAGGVGSGDNATIPSGFTYLGQFIDHDVTFDPTTMPEVQIDPQAVFNFRTPKLDLDSVYGTGPSTQPYLYDPDEPRLLVGRTQRGAGDPTIAPDFPNDLLRLGGRAVIGDPRNDENIVVAQTHLAFIKFHNKVLDQVKAEGIAPSNLFSEARRRVTWHYQRMVVDDFLGRLCDPAVLQDVLQNGRDFFLFDSEPFMPVEFSVAAYRFGHSQVRNAYNYNRVFRFGGVTPATLQLLFTFTFHSGPRAPNTIPVPSDWIIDWRRFFNVGSGVAPDATRSIDPLLADTLHTLPGGGGSLAARNLTRGVRMGLPSGQAVASTIGASVLTPAELSQGSDGQVLATLGLTETTPLWYYVLKEAQVQQNGERLGQVGSRIVAETFVGMLDGDALSYRRQNPGFQPTLFKPGSPPASPGKYTMADLLTFVDDLNPIG